MKLVCCILITILFGTSNCDGQLGKKSFLGKQKVEDIRNAWAIDSCGFGMRDSLITILEKNNRLYGLSENDIQYLFGKPLYFKIYERGKLITYRILGTYDTKLKLCDPNLIPKTLEIALDTCNLKVIYYRTWEE